MIGFAVGLGVVEDSSNLGQFRCLRDGVFHGYIALAIVWLRRSRLRTRPRDRMISARLACTLDQRVPFFPVIEVFDLTIGRRRALEGGGDTAYTSTPLQAIRRKGGIASP